MKEPKDMSIEELRSWARSTGINPAWIEIFSDWTQLHEMYSEYYNNKISCPGCGG